MLAQLFDPLIHLKLIAAIHKGSNIKYDSLTLQSEAMHDNNLTSMSFTRLTAFSRMSIKSHEIMFS